MENKCTAYVRHGRGHQSKTFCSLKEKHSVHYCHIMGEEATWKGKTASTGYFGELPTVD